VDEWYSQYDARATGEAADLKAGAHRTARRLPRTALWLVGGGVGYNLIEAGIAVWAGLQAGSIALLAFGLDSLIEVAAGAALLWRLSLELRRAGSGATERAERRVLRFIGLTFLALAAYVVAEAAHALVVRSRPQESLPGIVLAAVSLLVMPGLGWVKLRVARRLPSKALRAEAMETLACAYLSFSLLLGLSLNAALGWWWADPAVALLMVPWLLAQGVEALGAEG
jgi:divalent metal cation (Fe/Co/Zn/Cd) transporter